MTQHADVRRGRDIVARWCNLAEQRLDYLNELFETGRWRRYHGEREFLENIREARAAVEIWRDLEVREATLDNTVLDLSWLGRPRWNLPRSDILPAPVQRLQPTAAAEPLPREAPPDVLNALKGVLTSSAEAPTAPEAPDLDDLPPASRDIDVMMQQRYPLLRNTL
jgi:uncharacterized repeat protein (TIGR03809 family)